ncbi:MAG TPA: aminomethyl transferase family protein [Planctomycetes bacterium]|nr:aminomethyl transferase family protein [Planctomycetota bacterium]HIK61593.1 aminomethyl transferase family protein [Planctomycetota bacterium]
MTDSPILSYHERNGARMLGTAGSTLLTYGDVPAEYRAGLDDAILLDCTDRGMVHVSGTDALEFLHRITSCDVHALRSGQGNAGLLLDSKGKVVQMFDLARSAEDRFELSTPPGQAGELITALDTYIFTEDVKLSDESQGHAPIDMVGSHAGSVLGSVMGEVPEALLHHFETVESDWGPLRITNLPILGAPGWRLDGRPEQMLEVWEILASSGAVPGGLVARDSLRVEAIDPLWGVDVDASIYPQEARLEAAFSLTKGCYIGQEVVAKIDTYGGLNKRLMALRVDHDDPVAAGTRLWREADGEWRDLGVSTSWAYSFALDCGLVLAYVKRKHQEEGTVFRLDDGPGTATIVPEPVRT